MTRALIPLKYCTTDDLLLRYAFVACERFQCVIEILVSAQRECHRGMVSNGYHDRSSSSCTDTIAPSASPTATSAFAICWAVTS